MIGLFGLSRDELLGSISRKLKNPIQEEEIFSGEIKESHLKKVDRIFQKGLSFYTDPKPIVPKKENSIFFRKQQFNTELGLGDREIVNKTESRILSLSALRKLSNYSTKRKLPTYENSQSPKQAAYQIREKLYPEESYKEDRDFLKKVIQSFASNNILVIEFVENWNKKNKASVDGFFVAPDTIVIKRNRNGYKREIFTLAHELGHYLLGKEELDHLKFSKDRDRTEKWCDEFAFYFLAGRDVVQEMQSVPDDLIKHDGEEILDISNKNHISRLALFVYFATNRRITWDRYSVLRDNLKAEYRRKEQKRIQQKQEGLGPKNGRAPQPIFSPLEERIYASAFYEGVVEEYELLTHFKKKTVEEVLDG